MAWNMGQEAVPMKSLADFRSHQYKIVELATTEINAVTHATTGGGYGVLQNEPNTNEHATVVVKGQFQTLVGCGGIAIGDYVTAGVSGWATKIVSGGFNAPLTVLGRALSTAASGYLFTLDLDPQRILGNSGAVGV